MTEPGVFFVTRGQIADMSKITTYYFTTVSVQNSTMRRNNETILDSLILGPERSISRTSCIIFYIRTSKTRAAYLIPRPQCHRSKVKVQELPSPFRLQIIYRMFNSISRIVSENITLILPRKQQRHGVRDLWSCPVKTVPDQTRGDLSIHSGYDEPR